MKSRHKACKFPRGQCKFHASFERPPYFNNIRFYGCSCLIIGRGKRFVNNIVSWGLLGLWVISEVYLMWINYKGRFRYRLLEKNPLERWLQAKIGVFSLFVSFLLNFLLILFFSALVQFVFDISAELALASIISLFSGITFSNASFDKFSVESFEKYCLKCKNKMECSAFLNEKCSMKYLKHTVKMAAELTRETRNSKKSQNSLN